MTPIEAKEDLRLVTILAVAMEAIESMALKANINPEQLLAEHLYLVTKRIHNTGTENYLKQLCNGYQLLDEVLD